MLLRKNKILLIEDDVAIMETLSLFLHCEGYEVMKATTVEQGFELLKHSRPDLVLLDHGLGEDVSESIVDFLNEKYDGRIVVMTLVGVLFELDVLLRKIKESLDNQVKVNTHGRRVLKKELLAQNVSFNPVSAQIDRLRNY